MEIREAKFISSAKRLVDSPQERFPQFALIGRSNVGKSSLINMLCNNRKLAHTSSTPGKTRLVNYFLINNNWYLVDLPGYGYAKLSHKERDGLAKMIKEYVTKSRDLINLFVLLDSRHDLMKVDLEFINQLGEWGIPFSLVFTKSDKQGREAVKRQVERVSQELLNYWEELPPLFVTSAEKREGGEELLNYIEQLLNEIK